MITGVGHGEGRYRPLADYGLIGDCRSAALVGPDGSIDWFCWPRFDSPSVFARLLDADRGGHWRLAPLRTRGDGAIRYRPQTAILETEHESSEGRVRVIDLMTRPARGPAGPSLVLRVVEGLSGTVEMESLLDARPSYGLGEPEIESGDEVSAFRGPQFVARLRVKAPEVQGRWLPRRGLRHRFAVGAGERAVLALACGDCPFPEDPIRELDECERFWRSWCQRCRYEGEHAEAVSRSAITLKLLTHSETGAIVAAPTTSLPEEIGGVRNWDYRYTWLRDASLTIYSLLATAQVGEAAPFMRWVCDRVGELGDVSELRIMYRVDGSTEMPERELGHLEGYRGSGPVRVGNRAVDQLQLDVYGEVLDCLLLCSGYGVEFGYDVWPDFRRVVEWVAEHWRQPDDGIWEFRSGRRNFVYSKVMAWVALDRGAAFVEMTGAEGDARRWREEADRIRAEVLERGFSERLGAFKQSYENEALDASNLLIPLVKFLPADDPRVQGTVDATLRHLTEDGLVYRYRGADDGVPGGEGSFTICTFWLASALAMAGRTEQARQVFERVLSFAGPLGLFAEEIDPRTGEALGNYPQAFTHVGLLGAAVHLAQAGALEANAAAAEQAPAGAGHALAGSATTSGGRGQ